MDVLLVVGVFLLAVVIAERLEGRVPTVAQTDTWRQAITGLIQEPASMTFASRSVMASPTAEAVPQARRARTGSPADRETPVAAHPGVAPVR